MVYGNNIKRLMGDSDNSLSASAMMSASSFFAGAAKACLHGTLTANSLLVSEQACLAAACLHGLILASSLYELNTLIMISRENNFSDLYLIVKIFKR